MYIRRKVFSLLEVEGEERLFSTTDINLEDTEERIFSIKDEEAYGDIDKNAPEDPYYEKLIGKISKGAAIGGAGLATVGGLASALGEAGGRAQKGREALDKINKLKDDIRSAEFFSKDHFGHEGEDGFFGEQLKKDRERYKKVIDKSKAEIKETLSKNKKAIKAAKLSKKGKAALVSGTSLAILGGGSYLLNKLGDNYRRASKKDKKDILVQARKQK